MEIARLLVAKGDIVEFSSSGEVATLIQGKGYRCNLLPLSDVRYSETGAFLVKETLLTSPSILGRACRQVGLEVYNIESFAPDAILSDSALSTVLAGRILRLPTFTVLNQLNLASHYGSAGALSRLLSVGTSAGMGKLWQMSDEVILPDLPPPFTISEKNLWGSNVSKTRYVGFLFPAEESAPDGAATDFSDSPLPRVFWQVSGPPRTRTAFLGKALEFAGELSDHYTFAVSGGNPAGSRNPRRIRGGWYYEWCDIAGYYFANCDVVVSRAGHGTVGQSITASKPSLLVPIPKQPEQEGNAEKAAKLGISLVLSQDELSLTKVKESLNLLLHGEYLDKSRELAIVARGFDARRSILESLDSSSKKARRGRR